MAATPPTLVTIARVIRKIPPALLSLVFPDHCRVCEAELQEWSRIPVCSECLAKPAPLQAEHFCVACRTAFLNPYPLDDQGLCTLCRTGGTGFDRAYSFGAYEAELQSLILLFKYGRVATLAKPLGKLLSQAFPADADFDLIVPVPMYWRRRWQRGFNQAELLARDLAARTGLPVRNAMRRVHHNATQAGLTNAKRRANVTGAFRPKRDHRLSGKRIVLVDDVLTTGSTASACAKAMKRAGAAHVALITVARVDRRPMAAQRRDVAFPESTFSGSFKDAKLGSFA